MKLLADTRDYQDHDDIQPDSMFAEFFTADNRELLRDLKMARVIPQQSLRQSVRQVLKKTPKLDAAMRAASQGRLRRRRPARLHPEHLRGASDAGEAGELCLRV